MSLRTSLFNKSIFKSDIKRYWWTSLLDAFLIFIFTVLPIYERVSRGDIIGYSYGSISPSWLYFGGIIILIAFSVGLSTILFSYMHFQGSLSMHHSLPLKRPQMLFTKVLVGLTLLIVPILLNGIALTFMNTYPHYKEIVGFMPILRWCIIGIIYVLVVFSLTTAVNMMTGHPVGTLIFTGGFMLIPLLLVLFMETFLHEEVFGIISDIETELLKYIYISEKALLTVPYVIIYIAMTVAFFFGAYALYKNRKLESNGEVIAYSWLKPVFITIIAILSSLFSWAYFNDILNQKGILWLIPLGLVGTVIAWMVSRKSIHPKGVYKPICIYLVVTFLTSMVMEYDLTGFERRIPDADNVASVCVGNKPQKTGYNYFDGEKVMYTVNDMKDSNFTDKEDIEKVLILHKAIVDNHDEEAAGVHIPIEYTLKNGRKLKRAYTVNQYELADVMRPVYETPQMRSVQYALLNGTEKEYIRLEISDRRVNGNEALVISENDETIKTIIDALIKDMTEAPFEDMFAECGASTYIGITYHESITYEREVKDVDSFGERYEGIPIRRSYKNTLSVLKSIGYYDGLPEESDIASVKIATWIGETWKSEKELEADTVITDAGKIKGIYALYNDMIETRHYTNPEDCCNVRITYVLKSGKEFDVSASYDEQRLPEIFKAYF